MVRRLVLFLPAACVAVVMWLLLFAADREPAQGALVLGGPNVVGADLSVLVRVVSVGSDGRRPLPSFPLAVSLSSSGRNATWHGSTDATGHAEVRIKGSAEMRPDLTLRVTSSTGRQVLAEGRLSFPTDWASSARRRGGFHEAGAEGELSLEVAPSAGVLAVPFDGTLLIRARRPAQTDAGPGAPPDGRALPVQLQAELSGAEWVDLPTLPEPALPEPAPPGPTQAGSAAQVRAFATDDRGELKLAVRPMEHAVSLRLQARDADGRTGRWYGSLTVVPGAMGVMWHGNHLVVRSPVPRTHAFVSLVTEQGRVWGEVVALSPDETGGAKGSTRLSKATLTALTAGQQAWAVVSSEYDKRSPSAVGWPLVGASKPGLTPVSTFDASDRVLLDGTAAAQSRQSRARRAQRRLAAGLLLVIGLALGVLLWLQIRRPPAAPSRVAMAHEGEPDAAAREDARVLHRATSHDGWVAALAVAFVLVGVAALALFGTLKG